jgi:hypothetical protein
MTNVRLSIGFIRFKPYAEQYKEQCEERRTVRHNLNVNFALLYGAKIWVDIKEADMKFKLKT